MCTQKEDTFILMTFMYMSNTLTQLLHTHVSGKNLQLV